MIARSTPGLSQISSGRDTRFDDDEPEQLRCPACDWRSAPYASISGWYSESIYFHEHIRVAHPEEELCN